MRTARTQFSSTYTYACHLSNANKGHGKAKKGSKKIGCGASLSLTFYDKISADQAKGQQSRPPKCLIVVRRFLGCYQYPRIVGREEIDIFKDVRRGCETAECDQRAPAVVETGPRVQRILDIGRSPEPYPAPSPLLGSELPGQQLRRIWRHTGA